MPPPQNVRGIVQRKRNVVYVHKSCLSVIQVTEERVKFFFRLLPPYGSNSSTERYHAPTA